MTAPISAHPPRPLVKDHEPLPIPNVVVAVWQDRVDLVAELGFGEHKFGGSIHQLSVHRAGELKLFYIGTRVDPTWNAYSMFGVAATVYAQRADVADRQSPPR